MYISPQRHGSQLWSSFAIQWEFVIECLFWNKKETKNFFFKQFWISIFFNKTIWSSFNLFDVSDLNIYF